jgi:hypothetical protein
MAVLNRRKVAALYESDYDEAARLESLLCDLVSGESAAVRRECDDDRYGELSRHFEQLRGRHRAETAHWQRMLAEHEAEHESRARQLEEEQGREVEDFKAAWQDPEYVKQFHRPSVRLLQLRHVEKKLVLQKKYAEAKGLKKIADELQFEEEALAQRMLHERMRTDFAKLREKHRFEFQKLDEFFQDAALEMRRKMQKSLEPLGNALRAFETKKNSPMTKRQYVHYRKVSAAPMTQPCSTIPTPRTVEKWSRFRTGPPGLLNLEPMREETLSQLPLTPVRAKSQLQTPFGKGRPLPRL